jgi:hypothetical protein
MLNTTFSSSSVRGWRQNEEGNVITLPVTFNFIKSFGPNTSTPIGTAIKITNSGQYIFSAGPTTLPPANTDYTIRAITNYFNSWQITNINTPNNFPTVYDINSDGSKIAVMVYNTPVANSNIELRQFTSNFNSNILANITPNVAAGWVVSDISVNADFNIIGCAISNNLSNSNVAYAHIYNYDGANISLMANINYGKSTGSIDPRISINQPGNYAALSAPGSGNIQIYYKSGNTWISEANIAQANVRDVQINSYGNIIAINVDDSDDYTSIYRKSGNIWSLLNTFYGNVIGNTLNRPALDMNSEGTIIGSTLRFTVTSGTKELDRVAIYQYDNANANYILTQNLLSQFSNTSTIDVTFNSLSISKNIGYLVVHWDQQSINEHVEIWTCLS